MNDIKYIFLTAFCMVVLVIVISVPMPKGAVPVSQQKDDRLKIENQQVRLTRDQIFQGDLVLVNNQVPYHFETEQKDKIRSVYKNKADCYQVKDKNIKLSATTISQLNRMLTAFYNKKKLSTTSIWDGYRTKEYQQELFDQIKQSKGEEYAKSYVTNPGCSEYHTGLAINFKIRYKDGTTGNFVGSENERWMKREARNYGFIQRYPEKKKTITGISREDGHFRYVGVPHAIYIEKKKFCLEEYLDFLKDYKTQESPLRITHKNVDYEVFYTEKLSLSLPKNVYYTVSGDNQEGFIVTTYPIAQSEDVVTPSAVAAPVSGASI